MGNKATGLLIWTFWILLEWPPLDTINIPYLAQSLTLQYIGTQKGGGMSCMQWKEEFWHTPKGQLPIESSAKILSQSKQRYQFVPRWVLSIYGNGFTKSLARLNKPHSNGFPGVGAEAIYAQQQIDHVGKTTKSRGRSDGRTAHVGPWFVNKQGVPHKSDRSKFVKYKSRYLEEIERRREIAIRWPVSVIQKCKNSGLPFPLNWRYVKMWDHDARQGTLPIN